MQTYCRWRKNYGRLMPIVSLAAAQQAPGCARPLRWLEVAPDGRNVIVASSRPGQPCSGRAGTRDPGSIPPSPQRAGFSLRIAPAFRGRPPRHSCGRSREAQESAGAEAAGRGSPRSDRQGRRRRRQGTGLSGSCRSVPAAYQSRAVGSQSGACRRKYRRIPRSNAASALCSAAPWRRRAWPTR